MQFLLHQPYTNAEQSDGLFENLIFIISANANYNALNTAPLISNINSVNSLALFFINFSALLRHDRLEFDSLADQFGNQNTSSN